MKHPEFVMMHVKNNFMRTGHILHILKEIIEIEYEFINSVIVLIKRKLTNMINF